jgi:hypothetical protein
MPYRSGPVLVELFNEFGANDLYGQNFPTRWRYAEEKLHTLIGTPAFGRFITHIFDPREFLGSNLDAQTAVNHINEFLKFDGLAIVKDGAFYRLRDLIGASVDFTSPVRGSSEITHVFIDEQIAKCDDKLARDDYDGAITNARSLAEAVLSELERSLDPAPPPYDGDLPRLYRRVQKQLRLDPARPDISDTLKQILSGLTSVVSGIAAMRNKMGDAHAQSYRARKHHAKLAVNAAKTLADFLFETYQFQIAQTKKAAR